ncbi:MAG: hypothetical protein ACPKPY_04125 [Nitrososphaeraceae archaeon]
MNSIYGKEEGNVTNSNTPQFFVIQHANSGSLFMINVNFTLSSNMELNKLF